MVESQKGRPIQRLGTQSNMVSGSASTWLEKLLLTVKRAMYKKRKAVATPPATLLEVAWTDDTAPASTAKQMAIPEIQVRRSFRRPKVSISAQGMNEATKNQVKRAPESKAG